MNLSINDILKLLQTSTVSAQVCYNRDVNLTGKFISNKIDGVGKVTGIDMEIIYEHSPTIFNTNVFDICSFTLFVGDESITYVKDISTNDEMNDSEWSNVAHKATFKGSIQIYTIITKWKLLEK